jgi:hypothetical protein
VEFQNNQTGALMKVSTELAKKVKFSTNQLKLSNGLDFLKKFFTMDFVQVYRIEFKKLNVG